MDNNYVLYMIIVNYWPLLSLQFYRARYDSEGVRAPLKGINENYPAVELRGEGIKNAVVTVKLVHEDGSPHTCCSLDSSDDRKKALTKRASPINNMIKAE